MRAVKVLLGGSGLADLWIGATRGKARILMYHGVSPYGLHPDRFEQHLHYVARNFECYWVGEVPGLIERRRRLKKPAMILTFDDGLRNNLTRAVPLLRKYGLKATFFLVSGLLDATPGMLWNHEMLCRLLVAEPRSLPSEVALEDTDRGNRYEASRSIVERMKSWNHDRRVDLLNELRSRQPRPEYESWMLEKFQLMNREEVSGLPNNIEIGSHTRTHPILPTTGDDRARDEIERSRSELESMTGRPVTSFCYPNGRFSDRDESFVRDTYQVAVTVEEGLVGSHADRYRLPRIPAAHDMTDFRIRLIRPGAGDASPDPVSRLFQRSEEHP